jgi:hypothetical protein
MEPNPYESPRAADSQLERPRLIEIPFWQAVAESALWLALVGFALAVWLS